jgi:hypothetical protein
MFNLLDAVEISNPLFMGCVGQVVDFNHDAGAIVVKVDFLDKEDKINKQVFFKETELKKRVLRNG